MTLIDSVLHNSSADNDVPKTIVFLRTSSTARIPVYAHLQDLGYNMVMVHPNKLTDFEPFFVHWIESETDEPDAVEEALRSAMKVHSFSPDAIISFDEFGVFPAAVLAERFFLRPLPFSPSKCRVTSIKSIFRQWCYDHQINAPRSAALLSEFVEVSTAVDHLEFPVVVKPSPGAGSMLTRRCGNLEQLKAAVPVMWQELRAHPSLVHLEALGTKAHLLVEEYIGGQEVDMDCVVECGQIRFCSISDNFEVKPPYFCEQGGLTPTALDSHAQEALNNLLHSFVESHGRELNGVLHFEAKYDFAREKAFVIEVNLRPGSAETHTMVKTVYGVTLGECLVRLALGESLAPMQLEAATPKCVCASVNLYPDKEGVIKSLTVGQTEGLVALTPLQPGSCVAPPPKSFALMAWAVAQGRNAEEAVQRINAVTASVDAQIREACLFQPYADGVENGSLAFSFSR